MRVVPRKLIDAFAPAGRKRFSSREERVEMTVLLYQTDAYVQEFVAEVSDARDGAIVLDRTAFYPGGGGQPHDEGTIKTRSHTYRVTKVSKAGDRVLHWLDTGGLHPLPATGTHVEGRLDWSRRFALMRTHTALHILCGVIWRDYGAQVTGGNMQPLEARMDFELAHMSAGFAGEVEAKINAQVAAGREVTASILPRAEAFLIPDLIRTKINLLPEGITSVRVVEIEGLDMQADGGTHVSNTSQVGHIRVVKHESKGKINKRLRIALDT